MDRVERNAEARRTLNEFFEGSILPRLNTLHAAGKLPNLDSDPLWMEVLVEWRKAWLDNGAVCDVDAVKGLMIEAITTYERDTSPDERKNPGVCGYCGRPLTVIEYPGHDPLAGNRTLECRSCDVHRIEKVKQ